MNVKKIISTLPASVKLDIIDLQPVRMKNGRDGIRVTIDRLLTDNEKEKLKAARVIGVDCIAKYRYAPEIEKSYFYIV